MNRKTLVFGELVAAVLLLTYIFLGLRLDKVLLKSREETANQGPTVEERVSAIVDGYMSSISREDVENDMKWLTKDIGIRSWRDDPESKVTDKIYKKLLENGFTKDSCFIREFKRDDIVEKQTLIGKNVLAVIPTQKEYPDILLITAHFDTVKDTVGAVDNASGVTTLLELSRHLLEEKRDFGMEIRFLFSQGEEEGYCGVFAYREGISGEEIGRHVFCFNFDMTGKPKKPEDKYYLTVCTEAIPTRWHKSDKASANEGSLAIDETKKQLGDLGEDGYFSPVRAGKHDIVPLRQMGVDALTVSWRCIDSENSKGSDHDLAVPKNNHMKEDSLENFDMESLYSTTKLMMGSVVRYIYLHEYAE